ncbi:MAG TPA: septum site-determining protein Ssd [Nocardioidaceae bacterium]|nr:septum site-determining protein Ssd [Nocardioidaceae bacterium]
MSPFLSSRADPTPLSDPPGGVDAPVVVTRDTGLVGDLHRLAAAAGTSLDVVADVLTARARWAAAPVVLVGADMVGDLAETAPHRRERVHVVARGALPDTLFRAALAVGAENVVELPSAEAWLVEALTDTADGPAGRAVVVGVVGGCGGAGATTFATALAMAAASVVPAVTLVDADPLGAGIERVAGIEEPGSAWGSLLESAGRLGSRSLRASLPRRDGLAVLGWGQEPRGELDPHVVREVASAAQRGSDVVVVDLPRYVDPATSELMVRCDHAVVVAPLQLAALAATGRVVASVAPLVPNALLVTRGPVSAIEPVDVAAALGLPLGAAMRDQRHVEEAVELGLGPVRRSRGQLARAARTVLDRVGVPRR